MGFFDGWRKDHGPTLYGSLKTAVTSDVLEAGLIYCGVILVFSLFIVLPGFKGRQIVFAFLRMFFGVFVLTSIVLCNYGQEWEVATIETKTQYRAGLRHDINAHIGVKIGLRSINVTLKAGHVGQKFGQEFGQEFPPVLVELVSVALSYLHNMPTVWTGLPEKQRFLQGLVNETINYNERFSWDNEGWTQGRMGFGPRAGKFNQEYREAQHRGLPYPILWVAEYFTLDGEGIRWGRNYRQAGFYTNALIWTAFCCWILTLALLGLMRRYGGYFSLLTGGCLLLAAIIYASIRNPTPLSIPFEDAVLKFHWGWCFLLCVLNGVICVILGGVVIAFDLFASQLLATFFVADVAQELEEVYCSREELDEGGDIYYADATNSGDAATASNDDGPDEDYEDPYLARSSKPTVRTFRKRGITIKKPLVPWRKRASGSSNAHAGTETGTDAGPRKPNPPPKAARRFQAPRNGGASNVAFEEEEDHRL